MHTKILVAFLLAAGCTTATPRPRSAADAQLRFEIARAIAAEHDGQGARRITGLGPATADGAIVFTDRPAPPTAGGAATMERQEERWVRGPDGWKLADSKDLGADVVVDGRR